MLLSDLMIVFLVCNLEVNDNEDMHFNGDEKFPNASYMLFFFP